MNLQWTHVTSSFLLILFFMSKAQIALFSRHSPGKKRRSSMMRKILVSSLARHYGEWVKRESFLFFYAYNDAFTHLFCMMTWSPDDWTLCETTLSLFIDDSMDPFWICSTLRSLELSENSLFVVTGADASVATSILLFDQVWVDDLWKNVSSAGKQITSTIDRFTLNFLNWPSRDRRSRKAVWGGKFAKRRWEFSEFSFRRERFFHNMEYDRRAREGKEKCGRNKHQLKLKWKKLYEWMKGNFGFFDINIILFWFCARDHMEFSYFPTTRRQRKGSVMHELFDYIIKITLSFHFSPSSAGFFVYVRTAQKL